MCLRYDKEKTNEFINSDKETFTFYKVYLHIVSMSRLIAPFAKDEYFYKDMDTMTIVSSRKCKDMNHFEIDVEINDGIHAFIDKKDAFTLKYKFKEAAEVMVRDGYASAREAEKYKHAQVFEIKCRKDDIIAAGTCKIGNVSYGYTLYPSIAVMQGDVNLTPITEDAEVCA